MKKKRASIWCLENVFSWFFYVEMWEGKFFFFILYLQKKKFVQAGYLHFSHYNILHSEENVPILHFHPIMFSQSCREKIK